LYPLHHLILLAASHIAKLKSNNIFQYETDDVKQLESCVKVLMKKTQYRKYKEIYQVDLNIIKKTIKKCDKDIEEINKEINKKNNKQKGGIYYKNVDNDDKLFMLIPKI
jgi:hypothetical protein